MGTIMLWVSATIHIHSAACHGMKKRYLRPQSSLELFVQVHPCSQTVARPTETSSKMIALLTLFGRSNAPIHLLDKKQVDRLEGWPVLDVSTPALHHQGKQEVGTQLWLRQVGL